MPHFIYDPVFGRIGRAVTFGGGATATITDVNGNPLTVTMPNGSTGTTVTPDPVTGRVEFDTGASGPGVAQVTINGFTQQVTSGAWAANLPSQLTSIVSGSPSDTAVNAVVKTGGTATNNTLTAAYAPRWQPSTAYAAGQVVLSPSGDVVSATTAHTSGTTFAASSWTVVLTTAGTQSIAALDGRYAPVSGSANYAPATGSTAYAPASGSANYAPASGSTSYSAATAPNVQIFTANGTWTKPSGAVHVRVLLVGGGGGGGAATGAATGVAAAGGGGGGGYAEALFAASALAATQAVTVGAGGAGSTTSAVGGAGGSSTFADMTGAGGSGGGYGGTATTGTTGAAGGAGGAGTGGANGLYTRDGAGGGHGRVLSGNATWTNPGGESMWSPGAAALAGVGNGANATGYGGGGGGAYCATATTNGGNGSGGRVIVITTF